MAKLKLSMRCFLLLLYCCVNYAAAAFVPDDRAALKTAVNSCLKETPDGSCPIFSKTNDNGRYQTTIRKHNCSADNLVTSITTPQTLEQCRTKCAETKDCRFFAHGNEIKGKNCYQCKEEPIIGSTLIQKDDKYDIYQLIQYGVIGTWDTSKIRDMSTIFYEAKFFIQDV